ncbi:MAG: alpha/beta hydrolase, partial [Acidobacteria bacterium]
RDPPPTLQLDSCPIPGRDGETMLCGTLEVLEDRNARAGRRIPLRIAVLPATGEPEAPDPIVLLAGGPGQAATTFAPFVADSPLRRHRDVLLVDQRGTGGSNPLQCELPGDGDNLQGYLSGPFPPAEAFRSCRQQLAAKADLRHYSSVAAAHDLDQVRAALGYREINVMGGSYGTRAALVYMREYPERVRTAVLNGVAPIAFENPLFHARGAQRALDAIFAECRADDACRRAFGDPAEDFRAVVEQLRRQPAKVTISHPESGAPVTLELDEATFYEGLRVFMYGTGGTRRVPLILDRAAGGHYEPLLEAALGSTRAIQEILHWGMLLSVTCAEDVDRISEEEIARETAGTFLGDRRIRAQQAACRGWPRSCLPTYWAEPVAVGVPTLILSGTLDPVTPPEWGEKAARHLPNSLHLVVPGAHGVGGDCIDGVVARFLERGAVEGLDAGCTEAMELPPFVLSEDEPEDA